MNAFERKKRSKYVERGGGEEIEERRKQCTGIMERALPKIKFTEKEEGVNR